MARPIITLNGLRIVIMLGMLVITLYGIRFTAEIIVPFILALFVAVILNPLVQHMVCWHVSCVLAVSTLTTVIVMAIMLLLAYLGSALNELTWMLLRYHSSTMMPPQAIESLLQHIGVDVSVDQLVHYIDPSAAMALLTSLLTRLSNAMSLIFLLLLTVLFILLEVPQLPGKFQQMMARPVEGMTAIQRVINSVSHYLVLKITISIITGLVAWAVLVALGVRSAFVWGLLAFALSYISSVGSALAAIPPIAQVLVLNDFYEALLVPAGYLLVNLILGNILEPRIAGRRLGLSTLVVFSSSIFWGWLLEPVGMLFSVPLTVIVRIALEQITGGQSIAVLLSDLNKE